MVEGAQCGLSQGSVTRHPFFVVGGERESNRGSILRSPWRPQDDNALVARACAGRRDRRLVLVEVRGESEHQQGEADEDGNRSDDFGEIEQPERRRGADA